MKNKEYIAYEGKVFTIEWYFDAKGKSPSLDYVNKLDRSMQVKIIDLITLMGDFGEIKDITKFRYEGDKIYAFKPKPERFLCFFVKDRRIIVTNGFRKKQQMLPKNEKERALKYRNDYLKRTKSGDYYD